MYHLIGKRARVQLYTRDGLMLGALEGRIADVLPETDVSIVPGETVLKDLVRLVDLDDVVGPDGERTPYRNTAGDTGEMLAAVQDIQVLDDVDPALAGLSFN
jgi:hypothetical protein